MDTNECREAGWDRINDLERQLEAARAEAGRLRGALATAYSHGHNDGVNHFVPCLPDWIKEILAEKTSAFIEHPQPCGHPRAALSSECTLVCRWCEDVAAARAEGAAEAQAKLRNCQARYDALVTQLGDEIVTHVVLCASEHSNFEATLPMLQEEVSELSAALRDEHEHTPESEMIQIAAIAINWIRQLGNIPSREFVVSEAARHQYNRGYAEGAAGERERWLPIARNVKAFLFKMYRDSGKQPGDPITLYITELTAAIRASAGGKSE